MSLAWFASLGVRIITPGIIPVVAFAVVSAEIAHIRDCIAPIRIICIAVGLTPALEANLAW